MRALAVGLATLLLVASLPLAAAQPVSQGQLNKVDRSYTATDIKNAGSSGLYWNPCGGYFTGESQTEPCFAIGSGWAISRFTLPNTHGYGGDFVEVSARFSATAPGDKCNIILDGPNYYRQISGSECSGGSLQLIATFNPWDAAFSAGTFTVYIERAEVRNTAIILYEVHVKAGFRGWTADVTPEQQDPQINLNNPNALYPALCITTTTASGTALGPQTVKINWGDSTVETLPVPSRACHSFQAAAVPYVVTATVEDAIKRTASATFAHPVVVV